MPFAQFAVDPDTVFKVMTSSRLPPDELKSVSGKQGRLRDRPQAGRRQRSSRSATLAA